MEAQKHGRYMSRAGGASSITRRSGFCLRGASEIDGTPQADVGVDGKPEIEPIAAPPRQVAAGVNRVRHGARETRCRGMSFLDCEGSANLRKSTSGNIVGVEEPFHAALAGAILGARRRRRDLIRRVSPRFVAAVSCRLFSDGLLQALVEQKSSTATLRRFAEPRTTSKQPIEFFPRSARREKMLELRHESRPGRSA